MARERMVTRTIKELKATVLTVDTETQKVVNKVFTITGVETDEKVMLKQLKKNYETDTEKLVAIVATETTEKLFGMSEIEFLKYAKELPPRTNTD